MTQKLSLDDIVQWVMSLLIIGVMGIMCNCIGYGGTVAESIPGMLIFMVLSIIGLVLAKVIPVKIPAICYISTIGILIVLPFSPISQQVIAYASKIQLMAVVTPILAYAGITVGKDWGAFKKIGWRGLVVSVTVLLGTFLISGLLADLFLNIFGGR